MPKMSSHLFLSVLFFLLTLNAGVVLAEMASVSRDNVNIRSAPGMKEQVLWKLGQGFPLRVLKRSGKWLQVRDFEGESGWIPKSAVSKEGHMVVKVRKKVSLRSSPSVNSNIVAKAGYGVVLKTLGKRKGWVKVGQGGVTGWVREDLLWGF
ncbi:SH3 domain-containing protein [Candidatus Electronema sp. PJ]|uniref:SH3 domain-containing protein n=1 Tax=Candidatus Electronema sp. PJ TaxID=3401572 RepID=UPI003AA96491